MSQAIAIASKPRIVLPAGALAAIVAAALILAGCVVAYPEGAYYGPDYNYAPYPSYGYAPYPSFNFGYYYYGSPHRSYQPYGGYRHYR